MLHYYAMKFFSPVLILPELLPSGEVVQVTMVVDKISKQHSAPSQTASFFPVCLNFTDRDRLYSKSGSEERQRAGVGLDSDRSVLHVEMRQWSSFVPLQKWDVNLAVSECGR